MGEFIILCATGIIFLFFTVIIFAQIKNRPIYTSGMNTIEKASEIFIEDMASAKKEVKLVCGDFSKKFFAYEGIKESIKNASKQGIKVSAIIGDDFDKEAKEFLEKTDIELFEKKLEFNDLFRVIDENRFYVQKPRVGRLGKEKSREFIRGINSPYEAKILLDRYNSILEDI